MSYVRPMMQACAGEGECCRKVQESRPEKQEPCEKCNLKNQVQAAPDRHVASRLGEFVLCTLATPADIFAGADCAAMQLRLVEESPPPMLLRDLFHVHSLLLN